MRALQLEAFGQLTVAELPDPVAASGQVVIETLFTGICGSDIHGFTGENGRRVLGQVMGHESVGRIHSTGPDVDHALAPVGALATFNPLILAAENRELFAGREQHDPDRQVIGVVPDIVSGFAQRIVVPVENVVLLPESMPIAYGALIEPLAVALNAVRRVGVASGDVVLVVGGGPIGQSTVLSALREGASQVFVSDPSRQRRELCTLIGATALDPADGPIPAQVLLHNGGPVDVAIDAVGVTATLDDALNSTGFGGRVCLVGMGSPGLTVSAYRVSTEERSIVGSFCYSYAVFAETARWVGEGDPLFAQLISEEVSLDQANDAFARLAAGTSIPGKILVRLDR